EEELRNRLRDLRQRMKPAQTIGGESESEQTAVESLAPWERELLEIILLEPEGVPAVAEVVTPEQFNSSIAQTVYRRSCELSAAEIPPDFSRLLLEFDAPAVKSLLVDLDKHGRRKTDTEPAARLRQLLDHLQNRNQKLMLDVKERMLRERRLDADEEDAL